MDLFGHKSFLDKVKGAAIAIVVIVVALRVAIDLLIPLLPWLLCGGVIVCIVAFLYHRSTKL